MYVKTLFMLFQTKIRTNGKASISVGTYTVSVQCWHWRNGEVSCHKDANMFIWGGGSNDRYIFTTKYDTCFKYFWL